MFERHWPRDIDKKRPLNPDSKSLHGSNHALYRAACDYAERLAFKDAENHFHVLVRRNDEDYADLAALWLKIIEHYADLIEAVEHRSPAVVFNRKWTAYQGLFPNDVMKDVFDPRGFAARMASAPASPPATASPAEITVALVGPAQYRSISAALAAAPEGALIRVGPGLYREHLTLTKPVQLIADPADEVVIEGSTDHVVWMQTDFARLSGFSLRLRPASDNLQKAAVYIPQGRLILEDCRITSGALAGVEICNHGTDPVLRRCRITDGKAGGVFVYDNGAGLIEDCDITGNALAGVEIKRGGSPTLRQCRITDGKQAGVLVYENGAGLIEDCDITGNALAGVAVQTGGSPTLRQCRITDCGAGVFVQENGAGLLENCDITGNAYSGVEIKTGGSPTLRQCRIKRNLQRGVYAHTGGRGTVEGCDLRENKGGAWYIEDDSQVTRRNNQE